MSTPTTATATLHRSYSDRYHPQFASYQHHHQPYPVQANASSLYSQNTTNLPSILSPTGTRQPFPDSSSAQYSLVDHQPPVNPPPPLIANSVVLKPITRTLPPPHPHLSQQVPPQRLALQPGPDHTAMAARPNPEGSQPASQQNKRKRQRGETNWAEFYSNGLPKEVIVIDDDTPEPEGTATRSVASQTLSNAHVVTNQSAPSQPTAKRPRPNDHYDPVHHSNYVPSQNQAPRSLPSASNSLNSPASTSNRTNSAQHTTTATSLGSLSSQSYNDDYAQPGTKRRKLTRQQANEAKRRETAHADTFAVYKPPPYPPKKAGEVHVKVIADTSPNRGNNVDDDDGHMIVVPGNDLTDRYEIIKLLGQGTFGKVVQAKDKRRNKLVAVKIIRSVQKYRDASKIELRVLATLKANDEENRNRCIHLRDCFDFRGHICIVMDLLGQSVFDFLKENNFVPFPNSQILAFARQLFTSVAFLHDLNLIHTDLKPENILLCNQEYQTFTYSRTIPSSSTLTNRRAVHRKVLLDTEIRLIDFGSATFQDEYHSSVVSTRHYRAPEIILGLGWSFPCDIWSIGCILVEFYTGDALFQTHDNLEHLAMMEAVVNHKIDPTLVQQVNRMTRNGGNPAAKFFKRSKLDYPAPDTTRASKRFVKGMKSLDEIIPARNSRFLSLFLDLLKKIFTYDPNKRITAREALQHEWFREHLPPDDGTEATRIRLEKETERQRREAEARRTMLPAMHSA
ncbi:kinase-like domain-containing protein [Pseudoneurospora amorphoporcata]|uniref:Kinase-like domain-containing protein n=1 Tax=Pseudoneurospora amorphoporcata TaxID=241081 RepID=A0AAN6SH52_9PEZI|nr:kinase-like domain-containing protein [Pseudoneurospora amorphoporcata]